MERYVAFLRGMNLGGRRIKNEELKREFERLGLGEVSCFRASGNVIFETAEKGEEKLKLRIEADLGESLGYKVPVFLRNAAELEAVSAQEPFDTGLVNASKGKLQVAFLPAVPKVKARGQALGLGSDEDLLTIDGRELYWLPSGGLSESDLDLKAIEAAVGPWTMRTKGTVDQIAARLA
ncbi:MAG TPA: DUF1697 domain-containing protein [Solirubrobacterales bacterium]|jgi:uncharacterized protein (DUF1697 family)|nr:DUF1697 domain-containing protein [Solirubrobacterales bacterium]